jgi:hypothetical protein
MLGLFLGAGFSRWAVGLPLAHELFDFSISAFGPREATKLRRITRLKNNWDFDNPEQPAETFIAGALVRQDMSKELVLWYISRRLSEPFIWQDKYAFRNRRHVLMVDEKRKYQVEGVRKAQLLLSSIKGTDRLSGIVTTNYDLLTEYALGTTGYNYGIRGQKLTGRGPYPVSQWINPVILSGDISIAKIHGSISWDSNGYYTDGRRGLTGNALIVAPTPEKEPPTLLKAHWELAGRILSDTTDLLVFGFAFNSYDLAVLHLLRTFGQNLRRILLINPNPSIDSAAALWPQSEISSAPPPPEGQAAISSWLRQADTSH